MKEHSGPHLLPQPADPSASGLEFFSPDEDATRLLGEAVGEQLSPGCCLALIGDLGSGKTVFCQGLAWGLGVDRRAYINSPSFTYVREHQGRWPFYHLDLYRLSDPEELELIGLRDYLDRQGICAVEWPDRIPGWLPPQGLRILLRDSAPPDPPGRRIRLEALDPGASDVLDRLSRHFPSIPLR